MKMTSVVLADLVAASVVVTLHAQVKERSIPRLVKKDGRYALLVDDAPYLMLGAQVHNSSDWPAMLPKVWPAMEYLNVNTVSNVSSRPRPRKRARSPRPCRSDLGTRWCRMERPATIAPWGIRSRRGAFWLPS